MITPAISVDDFDVAVLPGMRERLADVYREFRSVQAASQTALTEPGLVAARPACPCCARPATDAVELFTKNDVAHVRCPGCQLVYTATVLVETADADQYADSAFMRAYVELKRHPVYARLEGDKARYLLDRAAAHTSVHNVLDIGASTGATMAAAVAAGFEAYGIEPDLAMAGPLGAEHRDRFATGYFPDDLPAGWPRFDVITLLDVLEHMPDPVGFAASIRPALTDRGLLLVQVPNFDSLLVQLDGPANSTFCVGHWQHFTATTLTTVLARAGFAPVELGNCISELDRIRAYPDDAVRATTGRLCGAAFVPESPDELYRHGLGYKLYGVFQAM
ncbi:MAG TPA: methyltransferase domain-containing protein [Ilumatobacter sp.]|nr:methyltransferase domain-containing protein [Ilumatobacter sp.]